MEPDQRVPNSQHLSRSPFSAKAMKGFIIGPVGVAVVWAVSIAILWAVLTMPTSAVR
jgi:hypothetical protein